MKKAIKEFIYSFLPLSSYYGKTFRNIFCQLMENSKMSREEQEQQKLNRLIELIDYAQKNVPYYRELFASNDINAGDIKSLKDYSQIPILTKNTLRYNLEKLKSDNFSELNPIKTETSGTTGRVTTLYRSAYHETYRLAVMWRLYHQNGFTFSDRLATLTSPWGLSANSAIYEYDRLLRKLMINTYHIQNGNSGKVLEALRNYKAKMLWGHPNILCALAEWMIENDQYPLKLPVIVTFGEKIYPHVRHLLNKAFDTKFVEYYGNRENSVAAWGDSNGIFREISEYCHVEVDNHKDSDEPDQGDLITTSLHNFAVPLIRYNSEDICHYLGYQGDDTYPSFELVGGRGKDVLLSRKGLVVPYTPHLFEHAKYNKLKKYQIEQQSIDKLLLRIVPLPAYDPQQDEELVLKHFNDVLANQFQIKIEYVDDIPLTENGKYQVAISPLAIQYLKNGA